MSTLFYVKGKGDRNLQDYKIHNEPTKNGQRDCESAGSGEQTQPSRLSGAVSRGGPTTEGGKGRALPGQGLGQGSRGKKRADQASGSNSSPQPRPPLL